MAVEAVSDLRDVDELIAHSGSSGRYDELVSLRAMIEVHADSFRGAVSWIFGIPSESPQRRQSGQSRSQSPSQREKTPGKRTFRGHFDTKNSSLKNIYLHFLQV
jgi:hypothetical protein